MLEKGVAEEVLGKSVAEQRLCGCVFVVVGLCFCGCVVANSAVEVLWWCLHGGVVLWWCRRVSVVV